MKDTILAYGVCADNNDPWGVGRIRVIVDDTLLPSVRTAINIQEYIAKRDVLAAAENQDHSYIPWELGVDGRPADPYVVEAFLPKHLNIIPKIGESVKIIHFNLGDETSQREYIAPQTSNYDKLNFDTIETARSFSKRSTYQPTKNNLRNNGYVANPTDIALTGRKNSEVVLPDNEVIVRAGYQNTDNQTKNQRNAIVQTSYYPQRKNVVTTTVSTDISPTKPINYLVEIFTNVYDKNVDPLYITSDIFIYPVQNVDTKNYNQYRDYLLDSTSEFFIRIKSTTSSNIVTFVNSLLKNLDRNNMPLAISSDWVSNPLNLNTQYWVIDNRVSENTEINFYPLNLYQVRQSPKNDYSIAEVSEVATGIASAMRPFSKIPTRQILEKKEDIVQNDPSCDESVVITGADKLFLLSWFNSAAIQNSISDYGFSQEDVYLILQQQTEALVKGDTLIKLLLDLIDLILNHGHSTGVDPIGSLNKDAVTKITEIKERYALTSPVTKNLTGGPSILNQYLRID